MSRAIGSFLILILVNQQTYCQNDFEGQILQRIEKLENENTLLKNKLLELQSLSASQKSCFQLALQGINKSGRFLLDPDGHHLNHPPMEVECKFPSYTTCIGF